MALSNRDRIGQMFDILSPALNQFITDVLTPHLAPGADWAQLVAAKDGAKGSKTYSATDPLMQLRMLSENITGQVKANWYPFDKHLAPVQRSYASELRTVRNSWAHGDAFVDDDAYRALDTAERLLKSISAGPAADQVAKIRKDLRRVTVNKGDRKPDLPTTGSVGLRPWREVLRPHDDVATGNFQASEFAADLYKVATGDPGEGRDYADPTEFFARTYLTEGLRDLVGRAVRRLSGDDNASPVINLQTNFGGGKTHSMLCLWHLAAGLPAGSFPQEWQELLQDAGYDKVPGSVRRVAIVGNHFAPSGETKPDGTRINTVWGELAWQLGEAQGYALVADADADLDPTGPRAAHPAGDLRPGRHSHRRMGRLRAQPGRPGRRGRRHLRRPVHLRPVADRGHEGGLRTAAGDLDPGIGEQRRSRGRRQCGGGRWLERAGGVATAAERRPADRRPMAARLAQGGVPHRPAAAVRHPGRRRHHRHQHHSAGLRRVLPEERWRVPDRFPGR